MKTWFITGVSSGFGRALAEAALERGDRVAGTLRSEEQRAAFDALKPGLSLGVRLDVTRHDDVRRAVALVEESFGPVDVLVNNAGYGHEGTIEETPLDEYRKQFDVNVFGAVSAIQAVLPYMRARRSGHIVNITSMGGIVTFPGLGVYHGSKFALEGISEALSKEVADLGIRVTAVEPGAFRTEWAGRSMNRGSASIADYEPLFAPLRKARAERSGKQPGDPAKAASAILTLVDSPKPPVHLPLGTDALAFIRCKLDTFSQEVTAWEPVASATNFD
ncbi:NAD(P)-dependent dehydrogenase (short-subunit alcohol dehydrogenase family) [Paraburkholderia sp. CI2]|uniref:oxidoreductase n=1 Tax=Paraburkholderia sp. CI2 TaxID=2723093 RepID=UPI00161B6981|nr:oxidoreductase [Paraburkholderia sp. CI2]MBB5466797.1 NAD(P)-dependent dehydrogenase (short-subunit alcohol dehydrogenase family) [Paraburkholderia sp. CI2]